MGILNLDQLKPGMVLAAELKDCNGRVLLHDGVELTDKHLRILKIWGITEAEIKGVTQEEIDSSETSEIDPAIVMYSLKQTKSRFRHTDFRHPAVQELFRVCAIRYARGLEGKPVPEEVAVAGGDGGDATQQDSSRDRLPPVDIHRLLEREIKLPSLPIIYEQIREVVDNPKSSSHNIARVIGKDTGLAARLLKLVNSPFYGYPSRIDSLSRAVTIVGVRQLSSLAIGITLTNIFKDIPEDLIDLKSFWKHSIACGILARVLAKVKNVPNSERLFVGGLLHDIGRLILFGYLPAHSKQLLIAASEKQSLLHATELEVLGFSHTRLGGALLRKWKFPGTLESIVAAHHDPSKSQHPLDACIVHTADIIANALSYGSSGERFVPPLDPKAWDYLGLQRSVIGPVINQLDLQVQEITQLLSAYE